MFILSIFIYNINNTSVIYQSDVLSSILIILKNMILLHLDHIIVAIGVDI